MKRITYTCDKCGRVIGDVVYTLTCYAKDINSTPLGGCSLEVVRQNSRQNNEAQLVERHLCRECKDAITDGVFIV